MTSREGWQDRLQAERAEVDDRLAKLRAFIYTEGQRATDEFNALPTDDRDDLLEQLMHMEGYVDVLTRRAARLVDADA